MAHWLFLPDDAMEDLATLAELPPEKVAKLREFLDSSDFQLRYQFFVKAADLLGVSDESAAKLCTFINYVQTQRAKNDQSGASVLDELEFFLERASKDKEVA